MAGALQGFSKTLNLSENTQDRNALNNLGEAPIADDISLFINNNQNTSSITVFVTEYDRIRGLVTIVNDTAELARARSAVFTNKDPVSLSYEDGTLIRNNLFIRDSDGESTFGFSTDVNGANEYTFRPSGTFIVTRPDAVVLENLTYLGVEQTTASLSSGLGDGDGGANDNDSSSNSLFSGDGFAGAFNEIYTYLDVAKYQAAKKFVSDQSVATDDSFELEGVFTIRDPGNTIVEEGLSTASPGLYISNPESPVRNIQKILAFSDTFNPWEQTNTGGVDYLTSQSASITAGDLKMTKNFDVTGVTPVTESGVVDSNTFTHKVPININGITYFLCLSIDP